jgi:glycosyltransferase involved in cell wall biosynthesis
MRWIKATDIGVIPHRDTEFIRTTVPNKLFQYMAASAMVIVSDVGPLSRIAEETDCGVSFRPDSPVDFAEAIRQWLKRTEERIERGRKGRKAVEERYCWEKLSQRYLDYFDSV